MGTAETIGIVSWVVSIVLLLVAVVLAIGWLPHSRLAWVSSVLLLVVVVVLLQRVYAVVKRETPFGGRRKGR